MKIALVGYGKMGHMIEQCALRDGHEVVATIDTFAEDASVKVNAGDTAAIARAVKSSGEEGINVQMISQGASKVNISMIVNDDEAEKTVQILHKAYFS